MLIQCAAAPFVGPDVAIDRLVADREPAVTAEPARHLLRTPILPQELLDLRPLSGRELPIASGVRAAAAGVPLGELGAIRPIARGPIALHLPRHGAAMARSEEHTSELQSQSNLVCRLLLEKKKKK